MTSLAVTSGRGRGWLPIFVFASLAFGVAVEAQVVAEPILAGRAFVGDSVLTSGSVVLHRMAADVQGEIDSVALAPDGSFVFRLPAVPDEAGGDMYFASVRHDGVMYFGDLVSRAVELDSIYVINAYDTLIAPPEGVSVAIEARSIFFEPSGSEWAITDLFQLRNDRDRTVVPGDGGRVWSYPLPADARDVSAEREMSPDVISAVDGDIVFRAALPPGPRLFVLRYFVDSLDVVVPTPGETEMLDVLVREPAPAISIEGLGQVESLEIEAGTTYRHFAGQSVSVPQIRITMVEEVPPPPVEWIAAILAVVLLGGGLLALRRAPGDAEAMVAGAGPDDRQSLLLQLAQLDEAYEREDEPSAARTTEYRKRRDELMSRLRALR